MRLFQLQDKKEVITKNLLLVSKSTLKKSLQKNQLNNATFIHDGVIKFRLSKTKFEFKPICLDVATCDVIFQLKSIFFDVGSYGV